MVALNVNLERQENNERIGVSKYKYETMCFNYQTSLLQAYSEDKND